MIARAEESEAEVRREDQERINRFARLNARKGEHAAEREQIQVRALDDKAILIRPTLTVLSLR
jgi:hypothetical protein